MGPFCRVRKGTTAGHVSLQYTPAGRPAIRSDHSDRPLGVTEEILIQVDSWNSLTNPERTKSFT